MRGCRSFAAYVLWIALAASAIPVAPGAATQSPASDIALVTSLIEAETDEARAELLSTSRNRLNAAIWQALIARGDDVRLQGDYDAALTAYGIARAVAERIADRAGVAKALNGIGVVHYYRSDLDIAREYYEKALASFEQLGDKEGMAESLTNIGLYHFVKANFADARAFQQKSLELREQIQDPKVGRSLLNLANVDFGEGDYRRALEGYRAALPHFEALADKVAVATALNNLATAFTEVSAYGLALEYGHRSLALQQELGHKEGIATILANLGNTAGYHGRDDLALRYHEQSLALREELGDRLNIARQLVFIGSLQLQAGAHQQALDAFRKGLSLQQAVGNKLGMADALASIGRALQAMDRHAEALEAFHQSLAQHEAIGGQRGMATVLAAIAEHYAGRGDHDRALDAAKRSAAFARTIDSRQILRESLTVAGRAYRALGRLAEAHRSFQEAIAAVEAMRADASGGESERLRFFEDRLAPYHERIALLIAEKRPADAFAVAERSKARVLLEVLRSGRIEITRAMTRPEQAEERHRKGEIASLGVQLARARRQTKPDPEQVSVLEKRLEDTRLAQDAFRLKVYAAHPELRAQRGETPVIDLQQTTELLPDAAIVLLEYVSREDDTDLFVITREMSGPSVRVFSLGIDRKRLSERTEAFRRSLARRDLSFGEESQALYRLLLAPASDLLAGKQRLIIVPDGPLWELPFQALRMQPDRYMLEAHSIAYAPSLTALREMRRMRHRNDTPRSSTTLLAFGNPALGTRATQRRAEQLNADTLLPLPDAERQVRMLAQLYGPARSRTYVGVEAREGRLKDHARNVRIVHFATHGLLNGASPMYSHLVLSQTGTADGEDGRLEAREVMELELDADLAVLAACETGRGRVGAGEGLIGLTWAFFVAGTPATVVSQWKVDAASTTDLMVEFHRQLLAGRGNADALRAAAVKLLRSNRYGHPFYWAPFVVVGDARFE